MPCLALSGNVMLHLRPSSMPGPRKEVSAVRLALSKDDLKTSLTPSESVTACSMHSVTSVT